MSVSVVTYEMFIQQLAMHYLNMGMELKYHIMLHKENVIINNIILTIVSFITLFVYKSNK